MNDRRRYLLLVGPLAVALCSNTLWAKSVQRHCPDIDGVESILSGPPHFVLGEMHGNDKTPQLFSALVCHLSRKSPVTAVLEIPISEQQRINTWLASHGTRGDRAQLLSGAFWTEAFQDGRRSEAMMSLLEALRTLKAQGSDVAVVAADPVEGNRNLGMAETLIAMAAKNPRARLAMLVGNVHARKTEFHSKKTMWQYAMEKGLTLQAVNTRYGGRGSTWVCFGGSPDDCWPHAVGDGSPVPPRVVLKPAARPEYDLVAEVGQPKFSPPAAYKPSAIQIERIQQTDERVQANAASEEGDFASCGAAYQKLASSPMSDAGDLYNAACCFAKAGQRDAAFASLEQALHRHVVSPADLANDADLNGLHSDARWSALVAGSPAAVPAVK